jgi:hypothetical protein
MIDTSIPGGFALQHRQVEVLPAQRLDLRIQALTGNARVETIMARPPERYQLRAQDPDVGDDEDDQAGRH